MDEGGLWTGGFTWLLAGGGFWLLILLWSGDGTGGLLAGWPVEAGCWLVEVGCWFDGGGCYTGEDVNGWFVFVGGLLIGGFSWFNKDWLVEGFFYGWIGWVLVFCKFEEEFFWAKGSVFLDGWGFWGFWGFRLLFYWIWDFWGCWG